MSNKPKEDKTKNITKITAQPRDAEPKSDEIEKVEAVEEVATTEETITAPAEETSDDQTTKSEATETVEETAVEVAEAEPEEKKETAEVSETKAEKTEKAKELKSAKATKPAKASKKSTPAENPDEKPLREVFILARPFVAVGRYLRDSWRELRQVRWPNRKSTWKMAFAVLAYCAIFIVFIVLLDMFFTFIFNLLLGQN